MELSWRVRSGLNLGVAIWARQTWCHLRHGAFLLCCLGLCKDCAISSTLNSWGALLVSCTAQVHRHAVYCSYMYFRVDLAGRDFREDLVLMVPR